MTSDKMNAAGLGGASRQCRSLSLMLTLAVCVAGCGSVTKNPPPGHVGYNGWEMAVNTIKGSTCVGVASLRQVRGVPVTGRTCSTFTSSGLLLDPPFESQNAQTVIAGAFGPNVTGIQVSLDGHPLSEPKTLMIRYVRGSKGQIGYFLGIGQPALSYTITTFNEAGLGTPKQYAGDIPQVCNRSDRCRLEP